MKRDSTRHRVAPSKQRWANKLVEDYMATQCSTVPTVLQTVPVHQSTVNTVGMATGVVNESIKRYKKPRILNF